MKRLLHCIALIFVIVFVLASCTAEKGIQSAVINEDGALVLTYTDGSTENLGVIKGEKGDKGDKGGDGLTPTIEISDDGYWVINGIKTNVKAKGEDGKDGENATIIDENPQGLAFYLKDDGTYAVGIGNAACLSVVVIPSTYKGKAVTEIPNEGFGIDYHGHKVYFLQKIILPDSIKRIGENAFPSCNTLTDVYYTSDEEAWNNIEIDRANDELADATIHFNYVPEG